VPPNWAGTPDGRYLEPFETVAKAKVRAARRDTPSPPEKNLKNNPMQRVESLCVTEHLRSSETSEDTRK
jgi:hypothetical protein